MASVQCVSPAPPPPPPPPSQCVFDGRQRLTFVLQVLLQLSEQMVPLLSIQKDLL